MENNLLLIIFFSFFSLLKSVFSVDPQFEACSVSKNCGDGQDIKFPFFIQNEQQSFCGYPGFKLSCNSKGNPVLKIQAKDYIVRQIVYDEHIVRVSNAEFLRTGSVCNISTERFGNFTIQEDRFQLVSNKSKLVLFYNCNLTRAGNLSDYRVPCGGGGDVANSTLALNGDNHVVGQAAKECKSGVVVPVEDVTVRGGSGRSSGGVDERVSNGFLMKWTASNCSVCENSGGKCGFDENIFHFRCFCPDRSHSRRCAEPGNRNLALELGLGITGSVVLLIIVVTTLIILHRRRNYRLGFLSRSASDPFSKSDVEGGNIYFGIPLFSYKELEQATSGFHAEKLLGDGGYGTVYYGKLQDGREVAVKRLYQHNYRRVEQFMNEIEILTRLRHKNLVSLYGCTSRRSHELLLVYEYIPNGTVADHLHGDLAKKGSVTWTIRMSIAVETANALAYLHASDIIHRDVKTNNILLDKNFSVKVADFGLSRLLPTDVTHVSTAPQGTPGYVDPEYYQCYQLTDKSDVYSFGVVLVELLSSMPAVDISRHTQEINLANLAVNKITKRAFGELLDPNLGHGSDDEIKRMTTLVAELAFRCLQQSKEMRPTMAEVVEELKSIQRLDSTFHNDEETYDLDEVMDNVQPPPSPPNWDDALLLKNIRPPPSPISVTEKWVSTTTTPSTSA